MRTDDEKKMVVPDFVADWYEKTRCYTKTLREMLNEIAFLESNDREVWKETLEEVDEFWYKTAEEIVAKMYLYGYEVEVKKYYWRKKKEHLAWFEGSGEYLSTGLNGEPILDVLLYSHTFTSQEARNLLKDDFDKFEKVECE